MADLTKEYTDMKDIKHKVEHFTIPADDRNSTEQIMEELLHALTRRPENPLSTKVTTFSLRSSGLITDLQYSSCVSQLMLFSRSTDLRA